VEGELDDGEGAGGAACGGLIWDPARPRIHGPPAAGCVHGNHLNFPHTIYYCSA
jgi:hypothetical protein